MSATLKGSFYTQQDKDIVFGFIKEAQKLLPCKENTYYTIPPLIGYIILPYFAALEYFTDHGEYMEVDEGKNICKYTGRGESNTVYGAFSINNTSGYNKLTWDLLVNIPDEGTIAVLGIDSSNKKSTDKSFITSEHVIYGWQCSMIYVDDKSGLLYSSNKQQGLYGDKYGEPFSKPDTNVRVEIDIQNKTLTYYVNGQNQGIVAREIDFYELNYHLAITLDEKADVQLLDFSVL